MQKRKEATYENTLDTSEKETKKYKTKYKLTINSLTVVKFFSEYYGCATYQETS